MVDPDLPATGWHTDRATLTFANMRGAFGLVLIRRAVAGYAGSF